MMKLIKPGNLNYLHSIHPPCQCHFLLFIIARKHFFVSLCPTLSPNRYVLLQNIVVKLLLNYENIHIVLTI
jgi:hypothetical protein